MPNSNGKAGMYKLSDVLTLARYLVNMATSLSNFSQEHVYAQYEIARIDLVIPTQSNAHRSSTRSDINTDERRAKRIDH